MKVKNFSLVILCVLFLFLRLYQLPQRVNFSMEPGMIIINTFKMWQEKKPTLIGLPSSIKSLNGRAFFNGAWIYYFLLPIFLLTNWNPLSGSYFFIIAQLLALLFLFFSIEKKYNRKTASLTFFLFTFTPQMIHFSRFIWNPNFLPLTTALLLYLTVKIEQKFKLIYFFLIGFLLGFAPGWHFQAFLLIPLTALWMLFKKYSLKPFLAVAAGFLIGFSPFIVFELKHNFYNLRTIILILKEGANKTLPFPPPFYYFLSLTPLLFFLAGRVLEKVLKKSLLVGWGIIFGFMLYSFLQIFSHSNRGFSMPEGWNYLGIKKTAQIILNENKKNYNIANLLYGDTRSYATRSFLIKAKHPPLGVEKYPQADYLFVISQHNNKETVNNSVWEISSFRPCKIEKKWAIQNNIKLYLLKKV